MTTTKKVPKLAGKPKAAKPYVMTTADKARMAMTPSFNGAAVIQAYQGSIIGNDVDLKVLIDQLRDTFTEVKGGDLHTLEAMLISQATALQTIFTSLARRAQNQTSQRNLEAFLGLSMKAQAQSRATISALVDLKYPRQATFVKQANIANGPQQINNGAAGANPEQYAQARPPAENSQTLQNELLEHQYGNTLEFGATGQTIGADTHLEAVGKVQRAAYAGR